MSAPVPTQRFPGEPITVEPQALEAIATELAALASELDGDAGHSRALAATFPVALGGEEGRAAGVTATEWAGLEEAVADRTRAIAGTLSAAAAAYLAEDAALSTTMGRRRLGGDRVPR